MSVSATNNYNGLDALQDAGEFVGQTCAAIGDTTNLSRIGTVVQNSLQAASLVKGEHVGSAFSGHFQTTSEVCDFVQFFEFGNYVASGQACEDVLAGGHEGKISLSTRVMFFVADLAGAALIAKEVAVAFFAAVVPHAVSLAISFVASGFAAVGFTLSLTSAAMELDKLRKEEAPSGERAVKQRKMEMTKVSLDLVYSVVGLAASVASIALTALGIASGVAIPVMLALGTAVAILGVAKFVFSAYHAKYCPAVPLTPVENKYGAAAQKVAEAAENLTQNTGSLNNVAKIVPAAVKVVESASGEVLQGTPADHIAGTFKTYSSVVGATGIFKRVSEWLIPKDGRYEWQDKEKTLKTFSKVFLTAGNGVEFAQFLGKNGAVDLGVASSTKVGGSLDALSFTKTALIAVSTFFGITDSAVNIDKYLKQKGEKEQGIRDWTDGNVDIQAAREDAAKTFRRLRAEQKAKAKSAWTQAARVAAKKKALEYKADARCIEDVNTTNAEFAQYKIKQLKAELYNLELGRDKGAMGIVNDVLKLGIMTLTSVGSGMNLLTLLPYSIAVVSVGMASGVMALIKTVFDALKKPKKINGIAKTLRPAGKPTGWARVEQETAAA